MHVNGMGIARRSRRRRTSFALFGRPLQRPGTTAPVVERALDGVDPLAAGVVGLNGHEPSATVPAPDERNQGQDDVHAVVARLQREASSDQRLLARMPAPELDRLIEESVRALWAESRVTAFVPLLAMRRVRDVLGVSEDTVANGIQPNHIDA